MEEAVAEKVFDILGGGHGIHQGLPELRLIRRADFHENSDAAYAHPAEEEDYAGHEGNDEIAV